MTIALSGTIPAFVRRATLILVLTAVVFMAAPPGVAHAATLTVDRADDSSAQSCTASANDCGLRGAINAANGGSPGPDTVEFAPGITTVTLTRSDLQNNNAVYDNDNTEGDLDITDDLTIDGGSGVIVEGATGWDERVVDVIGATSSGSSTDVTMADVTVRRGNATVGGVGSTNGGGIRVNGNGTVANGASLTLQRSTVTDNESVQSGGGIYDEFRSTITLQDSTVSNNTAGNNVNGLSGGIHSSGSLTLTGSTVSGNTSVDLGGGIFIGSVGTASITDSTISANRATSSGGNTNGGGIWSQGSLTLTRSTLSNNTAGGSAAGAGEGGGLWAGSGSSTQLVNTTVSGNTAQNGTNLGADGKGGGIFFSTTLSLANATITANTAGRGGGVFGDTGASTTLRNTIVAGNSAGISANLASAWTSEGHNLLGENPGGVTDTDIVNPNPLLGPLANNGGPTQTHALSANSPATDAANPATPGSGGTACVTTDQRGAPRPQDGDGDTTARCDIGAFEKGTGGGADNTPPTLDTGNHVTPRDGQTGVSRRTGISATFSEPMDLASLRAANVFTLKNTRTGAMVAPASIKLGNGGKTATFDPSPPRLAKRTKYEVRIKGGSGGAADAAGNALAADAVWTFTTRRR